MRESGNCGLLRHILVLCIGFIFLKGSTPRPSVYVPFFLCQCLRIAKGLKVGDRDGASEIRRENCGAQLVSNPKDEKVQGSHQSPTWSTMRFSCLEGLSLPAPLINEESSNYQFFFSSHDYDCESHIKNFTVCTRCISIKVRDTYICISLDCEEDLYKNFKLLIRTLAPQLFMYPCLSSLQVPC